MQNFPISLYTQLCNAELLQTAFEIVKQKGSAGGIDNVSVEDFEREQAQNLAVLLTELETETYVPHPYKEVKIPKGENEFRTLG
jgi:RNA-directed DNA polymerase